MTVTGGEIAMSTETDVNQVRPPDDLDKPLSFHHHTSTG